jgi:hypothetical protein
MPPVTKFGAGHQTSNVGDLAVQLTDAIGSFFVEFSRFETQSLGMALRSLSRDPVFVSQAEQLLDLEARLKLLERMAFAREIPARLMTELQACLVRARKLREHREEVARDLTTADTNVGHSSSNGDAQTRTTRLRSADRSRLVQLETLWMPAIARVQEYAAEAAELQETLRVITQKFENQPRSAGNAVAASG